jgi:hypothetical protein
VDWNRIETKTTVGYPLIVARKEELMADRPYTNVGLRTFLLSMEEVLGEKGD